MNIMLIDIRRIIESLEYSIKNINDYWDNQPYIPSQLDAAKEAKRQSIKPIEETLTKLRYARDWLKKNKCDMRVPQTLDEE